MTRDHEDADSTPSVGNRNDLHGIVTGTSLQAHSIGRDVTINMSGTPRRHIVPAQLPSCPPHFTDRDTERAELDRLLREADQQNRTLLVVISGQAGVGKTSLGLCWLHGIRDSFPDGQLYLDLRGFAGVPHLSPHAALARFLTALGLPPENVPTEVDEQSGLFRSMTAGRRLIVVLDNAVSAAQVRQLLPSDGTALVVVTTRLRLSGLALDGAAFVDVAPLDADSSLRLIERMLGAERVRSERDQARALAKFCGHLPLALCTSAARLATRRTWPIGHLVRELQDEQRRLGGLAAQDDRSVRTVFDASYVALPDRAKRLYRLLGLHPGTWFDRDMAAAVGNVTVREADGILDTLLHASLLQEVDPGRFSFHDLLRLHAREQIQDEVERTETQARIVRHHLDVAAAVEFRLSPGRWRLGQGYALRAEDEGLTPTELLDRMAAELDTTMAVQQLAFDIGRYAEAWQFCEALWTLLLRRKLYTQWAQTHDVARRAAERMSAPQEIARVRVQLATLHLNLRDFRAAEADAEAALALDRQSGHILGQTAALELRGVAELALNRPDKAAQTFEAALRLDQSLGRDRGIMLMARQLGGALRDLGRFEEAEERLELSRTLAADQDDRYNEARALTSLAAVLHDTGRSTASTEALRSALDLAASAGAEGQLAYIHVLLADRDPAGERSHLEAALDLYTSQGDGRAADVAARLARLSQSEGT